MSGREIIHVDMDEFFAAVEKLDNPSLVGQCLLVGGSASERGVVATASYEARVFGCRSAMAMAKAVRLCPQAVVIPPRGGRYQEVSERVFEILRRYSPLVEPVSIDEAFLDVTGCRQLLGPAETIARDIQGAIRRQVGLTASLGVAPNKFLAKLASDLRKPDGLVVITDQAVASVLEDLPIRKLWGVGPAGEKQFARLNIRTIGQLRRASVDLLRRQFGPAGEELWRLAMGQDDRPVTPDGQAKSIGQEETFSEDLGDLEELRGVLLRQVENVARRLRRQGLKARTVSLKLRYGDFTTLTRSHTAAEGTDVTEEIWRMAEQLLRAWAQRQGGPLRLLGATVSQLSPGGGQLALFEDPGRKKQEDLDQAVDRITERFGRDAVRRGSARLRKREGQD